MSHQRQSLVRLRPGRGCAGSVRVWKALSVSVFVLALYVSREQIAAAGEWSPTPRVLAAERLEAESLVLKKDGKPWLRMQVNQDIYPSIELLNTNGIPRLHLLLYDQEPEIQFLDKEGRPRMALTGSAEPNGRYGVFLSGPSGGMRAAFTCGKDASILVKGREKTFQAP